jgi:hypothetical protein
MLVYEHVGTLEDVYELKGAPCVNYPWDIS